VIYTPANIFRLPEIQSQADDANIVGDRRGRDFRSLTLIHSDRLEKEVTIDRNWGDDHYYMS